MNQYPTKNSKEICKCSVINPKSHCYSPLIKLVISAKSQHFPTVRIPREPILDYVTQI